MATLRHTRPVKDMLLAQQRGKRASEQTCKREERSLPATLSRLKLKTAMELIKPMLLYTCMFKLLCAKAKRIYGNTFMLLCIIKRILIIWLILIS